MSFKATDYVITPADLFRAIRALFRLSWRDWVRILVVGAILALLWKMYGVDLSDLAFIGLFLSVFAWNLDARIPIGGALAGLVLIMAIMLVGPHTEYVNETTWPEVVAVWVYYFLVIGVLKQVKDVFMEGRGEAGVQDTLVVDEIQKGAVAIAPTSQVAESTRDSESSPVVPPRRPGLAPIGDHLSRSPNGKYVIMKKGRQLIFVKYGKGRKK
jgi:hypothetical protein